MFAAITPGAEDAIFKTNRLYNECTSPLKVSCGVGAYRDNFGKPLVMSAIIEAKKRLNSQPDQSWIHEYLPPAGSPKFNKLTAELAFGKDYKKYSDQGRIGSCQGLSGTGSLFLAAKLFAEFSPNQKIIIPNPTWGNHKAVFKDAGLEISEYRYLDETCMTTPKLALDNIIEDFEKQEDGTIVLLHLCAHNPTGVDPTLEQWKVLSEICLRKKFVVLFDNAYQGFASGDLDADASPLGVFLEKGINPFMACSFAKNMGLYGERTGVLHWLAPDKETCANTLSQVAIIARRTYSNPPQFGAQLVTLVLGDEHLKKMWKDELRSMSERIQAMRTSLRDKIIAATGDPASSWNHITAQIGMFSYTGLTEAQVKHCGEVGSLFMLTTGRVSMAGVNEGNVDRVAKVIAAAIKACPA